ncbi:MAG: PEGA domain-containing protein [Myxococcales bacterium]|jgi:hypothetical protein|nr:PEGA domain-containing protein [Myxococcales bacterium]
MNFPVCLFVILGCLLAFTTLVRADPIPKIAVLPLVALDGSVELGAGETLRDLLTAELNRQDIAEAEAMSIAPDLASLTALEAGRRALDAARQHAEARSIDAAIASLNEAIAAFETGGDIALIAQAHSARALALFQRGRDDEAQAGLRQALIFSPDAPLPEEKASPIFSRKVQTLRAQLAENSRSNLSIDSLPAGARVEVDGRSVGSTPLLVRDLAPGRHLVRALMPSSRQALVQMVELTKEAEAKLLFRRPHADPLATLLDLLAENRVDARVIDAALKLGFSRVMGGVLSGDGQGNVRLDAFLLDLKARHLHRPAPLTFDRDLLSAGIELSKLCRALLSSQVEALPSAIRPDGLPTGTRADVRFGALKADRATSSSSEVRPASRRPIDARKAAGELKPRER